MFTGTVLVWATVVLVFHYSLMIQVNRLPIWCLSAPFRQDTLLPSILAGLKQNMLYCQQQENYHKYTDLRCL